MKVLCVFNPKSGGGLPQQRWPYVRDLLASFGISYELLSDPCEPIDAQVFKRLNNGASDIAAIAGIGGDGTQSAAINGIMGFRAKNPGVAVPPYCFIPMGAGNDIAKSFGLTSRADFFVDDLRRAVSAIRYGADYHLDLGILGDRYFADALTVGVDSSILRERNRQKRWMEKMPVLKWPAGGLLLYSWVCWSRIARHTTFNAQVIADGEEWYNGPVVNLLINNTRIYAGVFDFCTGSFGNDGLLDVILFTGHTDYLGRYLLSLRYYPRNIRGIANRLGAASSHIQAKDIVLKLSRSEPAQIDGEELQGSDAFHVRVCPQAIRVKIPVEP